MHSPLPHSLPESPGSSFRDSIIEKRPLRVFCGSADPWVQHRFAINSSDLCRHLAILFLLFDDVILSPSYIVESQVTRDALDAFSPFLDAGSLRIAIRTPGHRLIDYVGIKQLEPAIADLGDFPTYTNYQEREIEATARAWTSRILPVSRADELPEMIANAFAEDFLIDSHRGLTTVSQHLGRILADAPYFRKEHFLLALRRSNLDHSAYIAAMDQSTQNFVLNSAISTGSVAALLWPRVALPLRYGRLSFIGSVPLISGLLESVLGFQESLYPRIKPAALLRVRDTDEWLYFRSIYFAIIDEIESPPYSPALYIALDQLWRRDIRLGKMRRALAHVDSWVFSAAVALVAGVVNSMTGVPPLYGVGSGILARIAASVVRRQFRGGLALADFRNKLLHCEALLERADAAARDVRDYMRGQL